MPKAKLRGEKSLAFDGAIIEAALTQPQGVFCTHAAPLPVAVGPFLGSA